MYTNVCVYIYIGSFLPLAERNNWNPLKQSYLIYGVDGEEDKPVVYCEEYGLETRLGIYIYIFLCMYVYTCMFMFICIYVYLHVCIYINRLSIARNTD
jgi:hypothetical protein